MRVLCFTPTAAFQSTPSVGRATESKSQSTSFVNISIHALRGEGDQLVGIYFEEVIYFNPRPPWGGRRIPKIAKRLERVISIHALRGEGDVEGSVLYAYGGISIHALRGEGDHKGRLYRNSPHISIHALRGEGDDADSIYSSHAFYFNPRPPWGGRQAALSGLPCHELTFQSTPSVGRATSASFQVSQLTAISIHALRGEGDSM